MTTLRPRFGAFAGGPGILVLANTGSNAFGRNAAGTTARAGGYSHHFGDKGSAYWIGATALRAAMLSYDGRGPKSRQHEQAVSATYGSALRPLMTRMADETPDPAAIARLAPVVGELTDELPVHILSDAADHLVSHVAALRNQLGAVPVSMYGPVFDIALIKRRFTTGTGAVEPAAPMEMGAVYLALHAAPDRSRGWESRES